MSYMVEGDAAAVPHADKPEIAPRRREEKIMGPDSLLCPECGFENPLDAEYCGGCGKHIIQEAVDLATLSRSPLDAEAYTVAFVCPKCGHPSDLATPDCLKCGIIFTKWYEGLDDLSVEEAEQLARLREIQSERERAAEAENRRIEAQRKAELERQREALKRRKAQIQAQREAEAAARQKAEEEARQRAEATKRQHAEKDARLKAEAEKRRQAEEEARQKAEAEEHRRAAEEEARQKAEAEKRRQAEEEAHLKAEAEERRQAEEDARQKAEAEKRRQAEEEARLKTDAEKRRQAEEDARLKAEEDARQKAEVIKQEKTFSMQQILKALRPKGRLSDLLRKYENRSVGLKRGADKPLEALTLLRTLEDYMVLHAEDTSRLVHIPLGRIDRLEENLDSQNGTSEANGTLVIVLIGSA